MVATELEQFLNHLAVLAVHGKVAASSQNLTKSDLLYL